jgi:hypothetical protein
MSNLFFYPKIIDYNINIINKYLINIYLPYLKFFLHDFFKLFHI